MSTKKMASETGQWLHDFFLMKLDGKTTLWSSTPQKVNDDKFLVLKKSSETEHLLENAYPKHPSMYIGQKL
jgi:hypothetical protein